MKVKISEIIVGDRRRGDMGDIKGLADSIAKHGLLHPIVVDENNNLVAGGRRLEACKRLGWEEIPATLLGDLTERELREIELEENVQRKDLTDYERSKKFDELAKIKAEKLKEGFCATMAQKSDDKKQGRPVKPDSIRIVAQEMGIPPKSLHNYQQHVKAVEEYPELKELPMTHAIQIARQLNSRPTEEKEEKLEQLRDISETGKRREAEIDRTYAVKKEYDKAVYAIATLTVDEEHLDAWLSNVPTNELQRKWELIEEGIENLEAIQDHFKTLFGKPRLVKLEGGKK